MKKKAKDKAGEEYGINVKYDENGFKEFGNIDSDKPKIFFIGDSYTASIEVSNEKSFFNLIKDSLDVEVFVLAAGGYGTLQEYLTMDRWIDTISPDLLVLEVCNNDFIDNTPEMERLAAYKVSERRPYLDSLGQIFYERPISQWEELQKKILFFKWLDVKWKVLTGKLKGKEWHPAEYYVSNLKMKYPPLVRSAKITEDIIVKIKNRLPENTKMLAFSADSFSPQIVIFRNIFSKYKIPFAEEPSRLCTFSKNKGTTPFAGDGYHWNEHGHFLIAKGLIPQIEKTLVKSHK